MDVSPDQFAWSLFCGNEPHYAAEDIDKVASCTY